MKTWVHGKHGDQATPLPGTSVHGPAIFAARADALTALSNKQHGVWGTVDERGRLLTWERRYRVGPVKNLSKMPGLSGRLLTEGGIVRSLRRLLVIFHNVSSKDMFGVVFAFVKLSSK